MHIDHDNLVLRSEGDVETKVVVPLISSELYLNVPSRNFFSKEYLAPSDLDKGAKVIGGYFPDYSVWLDGFPVLIAEVKAPGVPVEQAYREAALYARHLNSQYPHGMNPTKFVIACNGDALAFGKWDAPPDLIVDPRLLRPGSPELEQAFQEYGITALRAHAAACLDQVRLKPGRRPFNLAGGAALLAAKKPLNSFAADLSPVLRRYFSSTDAGNAEEIARRAYVSSAEVTEYDKVLEALLKDRAQLKRDTIVERLEPTRKDEPHITKAIETFAKERPAAGQLQIIQGAVGAGKSLFIRRYMAVLQPEAMSGRTRWAWIDFNGGPADLSSAQLWLCEAFYESLTSENNIDLNTMEALRGIFSRKIQRRKPIYDDVAKSSPEQAALLRAEDLRKWQDDPVELARGVADHILGQRNEVLIAVMDNVDRLDLKNQLHAFQLALWFMGQTRCFVILQMRDETYERYKNRPPLDTFRTGIAFHISPPRFIDVVKKRLDLSIEFLASRSSDNRSYTLPSGAKIVIPSSDLGRFLHELYIELFERRRNISRILEALAGRDVRRALEMFVSIITSGHLGEDQITSQVRGAGSLHISEHNILRILMRTDYRFFSRQSGFVTNIFEFENNWKKPNNFILSELLYYLATYRKRVGQIGIEGYFTVRYLETELQKIGYEPDDVLGAANFLIQRGLIIADHMNSVAVEHDDSIKISASGFIHLRILAERIEYLWGIVPTTPISDEQVGAVLGEAVKRENRLGDLSAAAKVAALNVLAKYLIDQAVEARSAAGMKFDINDPSSGASYVLRAIRHALATYKTHAQPTATNTLDT